MAHDNREIPELAVIVTTYNRAALLPQSIESVLGQTFQNFELFVIDDGSTDGTEDVVAAFLSDNRLRYIRTENAGQASALNRGIAESCAPLVAFLDSDCRWRPERLQRHVKVINENEEVGVLYSENAAISETGDIVGAPSMRRYSGWVTDRLLIDNFVTFNSATVRRSIIEKVGAFDVCLRRNPDYDFWLRASTVTKFLYLPETLTEYRVMSNQLSSNKLARFESNKKILERFIRDHYGHVSTIRKRSIMAGFYYRKSTHHARSGEQMLALVDLAKCFFQAPWHKGNAIGLARIMKGVLLKAQRRAHGNEERRPSST